MSEKKRVHLNYAQSRQLDQWLHANLTRLSGHGYDFAADAYNDSGELDFRVTGNNVERLVDQVETLATIKTGHDDTEKTLAALASEMKELRAILFDAVGELLDLGEKVNGLADKQSTHALSLNLMSNAMRRVTEALCRLDPVFSANVPDVPVLAPDTQVGMDLATAIETIERRRILNG